MVIQFTIQCFIRLRTNEPHFIGAENNFVLVADQVKGSKGRYIIEDFIVYRK